MRKEGASIRMMMVMMILIIVMTTTKNQVLLRKRKEKEMKDQEKRLNVYYRCGGWRGACGDFVYR